MKKNILAVLLMVAAFAGSTLTTAAAENAEVVFTKDKELIYSNVTETDGSTVHLGDAFKDVAPGEVRSQIITLMNENDNTVDFYMNTEVLQALEESREQAGGAGYEIVLTVGDRELYNSVLGGYESDSDLGSTTGLKAMNDSVLDEDVLVATLQKGESTQVVLQIAFDGEAMDNQAESVDYSNALGEVSFHFKAGYEEPTGITTSKKIVTEKEETKYITKIVEEYAPLAAVKTGDEAMLLGAVAVFAIGAVLFVVAGRKKKVEE